MRKYNKKGVCPITFGRYCVLLFPFFIYIFFEKYIFISYIFISFGLAWLAKI